MTEINPMVPATGCLETQRMRVLPGGGGEDLTVHYPVFGLLADGRTLVIELHRRPATCVDLESLLVMGGDHGSAYPESYPCGHLWEWYPACGCRGETVTQEPASAQEAEVFLDSWAEWKARHDASYFAGAAPAAT